MMQRLMMMVAISLMMMSYEEGTLAFAPSSLGSDARLSSTRSHMIDPSGLDDVVHHVDALRVSFLECDQDGCAMAQGISNGKEWHIHGGLPPNSNNPDNSHLEKVLMIVSDDDP